MPLADAGVDVFDASVRYYNRAAFDGSPMNLAGWARQVTGKMSVAVGGIGASQGMYDKGASDVAAIDYTPLLQRFANKEFDLVAVGRAMIGDPAWGNKFRSGQLPRPYDQQDLKALA
jgi:2,4-dienoyl-CoA reductase-like NADH-dependent reductase (Old Yellow Enzyme family)